LVLFHGWDERLSERVARNPVLRRLFHRIYAKVELCLVLCVSFKEQLERLGFPPEKIQIMTTMYRQENIPERDTRDKENARIQVLFMARLLKSKGPHIMTGVGKQLVENGYKNFRFIIAGEGPESGSLRDFITRNGLEDFIQMPGNILGEEKKKILAASDIFLLPSESEGCPIAMLEAMGAGLAVIARPVGAIPDIIESGKNGYLIDSHDVRPFYEALVRLLEDTELLGNIQTQNRQKARENYDVEAVTKKIENLYMSLIQNGND
jgi:glycosyltransferase involved in cell wall biosynthesis